MNYAIIRLQGQQFKVAEGEEFLVNKLAAGARPEAEVLMISEDSKVEIGQPVLKNAKAELKIVEDEVKGEKLHVYKYKSKSRYRRKIGSRQKFTKLLLTRVKK